jgi:hypothetical protein
MIEMTTTALPSRTTAKDVVKQLLLLAAEKKWIGATLHGDEHSSRVTPRVASSLHSKDATEINNLLSAFPVRQLVQAALDLSSESASKGRTVNEKIPFHLTDICPEVSFRLQWNPAGLAYAALPEGSKAGDHMFIRLSKKHRR